MLYRAYNEKYYEPLGNINLFREISFKHVSIGFIDRVKELNYSIHNKIIDSKVLENFRQSGIIDKELSNTESKGKFIRIIDRILGIKPIYRFIFQYDDFSKPLYKCYEVCHNVYKGVISEELYYSLDKRIYYFKEIKDEIVPSPTILKINNEYLPFFNLNELENVYVSKHGTLISKDLLTDKQKCYVNQHQEAMQLLYGHIQRDPPSMMKGY